MYVSLPVLTTKQISTMPNLYWAENSLFWVLLFCYITSKMDYWNKLIFNLGRSEKCINSVVFNFQHMKPCLPSLQASLCVLKSSCGGGVAINTAIAPLPLDFLDGPNAIVLCMGPGLQAWSSMGTQQACGARLSGCAPDKALVRLADILIRPVDWLHTTDLGPWGQKAGHPCTNPLQYTINSFICCSSRCLKKKNLTRYKCQQRNQMSFSTIEN